MVRNRRIRRIVLDTLWEKGAMTKGQMYEHIHENYKLLKEPTEHSLSSIMNKNCQVIPVGTEVTTTETGNKTLHTLFDIDRELITTNEELIMTMPVGILTKAESKDVGRCHQCARLRILLVNGLCLQCHKQESP